MNDYDIIVIGAGAAGLMVAHELSKAEKRVVILEADNRIGGRIFTIKGDFSQPTELGAEFVHGDLPVTEQLLKAAKIKYYETGGRMLTIADRGDGNNFMAGWDVLEEKLLEVKEDMSIETFLKTYFSDDKYKGLRSSIKSFAEGYDTADTSIASIFAFRDEWLSEENQSQYRVEGGYGNLLNYLADEIEKHAGIIKLSSVVKEIQWQNGKAEIKTEAGNSCNCNKVVVTVPLGVLTAEETTEAAIKFTPAIANYINAAKNIGYGCIIKLLFEFDSPFWYDKETEKRVGENLDGMSFLFSGEEIPTWWTHYPLKSNLITGWLGGSRAEKLKYTDEKTLYKKAITSLSNIFKLPVADLEKKLRTYKIVNWSTKPFTLGSYSYATLDTAEARKLLTQPLQNTLYFAGEALYEGPEMGTVEAAFASGLKTAQDILKA